MTHGTIWHRGLRGLALLASLGVLGGTACANIFPVPDGDVAALRQAIHDANGNAENDVIVLADGGTYTLTDVDNATNGNNGLPVIGSDGGHSLAIFFNATIRRSTVSGTPDFRILNVASGARLILDDLVIAHGKASGGNDLTSEGGAILNQGTLTLTNSTLSDNTALLFGGGIYNDFSASLTLTDCTVSDNTAIDSGGGLFAGISDVTITGCLFSGNSGRVFGGAIYGLRSPLALTDCTLSDNVAFAGGGLANGDGGEATLNNVAFSNNAVAFSGGAIFTDGRANSSTKLTLTNCTLSGNTATNTTDTFGGVGGGIENLSGGLTVQNCTLENNFASKRGGGIHTDLGQTIVRNTTFNFNRVENFATPDPGGTGAPAYGGAISNTGDLTVNRSTFNGNRATGGFGGNNPGGVGGTGGEACGGIFNDTGGTLTLVNSTFFDSAGRGGPGGSGSFASSATSGATPDARGVIVIGTVGGTGGAAVGAVLSRGAMNVTACTLSANSGGGGAGGAGDIPGARGEGIGGLANDGGTATVRNTICANNSGENGGGPDVDGAFTSGGYNFIGIRASSTGFSNTVNHDQVGTPAAPKDPMLGPLQDNGGPTFTMALQPGSPALDKGKSFGLTTDQRELPRPVDLSGIANASDGSDIGAYERGNGVVFISVLLRISDVTVTEGDSGTLSAVFTVTRSGNTTGTSSVHYATANGTATAGNDYSATSGTRTFSPGQTTKTIAVAVKGDTLDEANETFKVNLSSPANASIADGLGVGTITDNDPLPALRLSDAPAKVEGNAGATHNALFTVTLTGATGRTVTVHYATANGTATAGSDYTAATGTITFLPGQTSKTLPIQVKGDATVEPNESFKVNLSDATFATIVDSQGLHTITNDDGSE